MSPSRPVEYAWGIAAVAACTAVCQLMFPHFQLADLIMVYLLGVVTVSTRFGLYPSIFTAIASVLSFDFFFIPPRFSFTIFGPKHLVTLFVMLFAAVVTSGLTERARRKADDAHRAQAQVESERLRSLLLSSISHDLRTPLSAIMGAASTLLDDDATLDRDTRRDLTQTVFEESERLHRLLTNLLHMTRLEAGPVQIRKEWQPIEEVIRGGTHPAGVASARSRSDHAPAGEAHIGAVRRCPHRASIGQPHRERASLHPQGEPHRDLGDGNRVDGDDRGRRPRPGDPTGPGGANLREVSPRGPGPRRRRHGSRSHDL